MAYTSKFTGAEIDSALADIRGCLPLYTSDTPQLSSLLESILSRLTTLESGIGGETTTIVAKVGPNLKVGTFKCGEGL